MQAECHCFAGCTFGASLPVCLRRSRYSLSVFTCEVLTSFSRTHKESPHSLPAVRGNQHYGNAFASFRSPRLPPPVLV